MKTFALLRQFRVVLMLATAGLVACGGGSESAVDTAPVAPARVFKPVDVLAGTLQLGLPTFTPRGAAQDSAGNLYVSDLGDRSINKVAPDGTVSRLAPGVGLLGAQVSPNGVSGGFAIDAAGLIYLAESDTHTVSKISPQGVRTLLAGLPGAAGSSDGPPGVARLTNPFRIALDPAGNVFVLSPLAVRKLAPDGTVSTFPVTPDQVAGGSGVSGDQRFSGIAVDGDGNVYLGVPSPGIGGSAMEDSGAVRKFSPTGRPLPLAGTVDGSVRIPFPQDIGLDGAGNLFVLNSGRLLSSSGGARDFRSLVHISPQGVRTIVAGADGVEQNPVDGEGPIARFVEPTAMSVRADGQVLVVDKGAVRRVDPQGFVRTIVASLPPGETDGPGLTARFSAPHSLAASPDGNLYVVDPGSRAIRQISREGVVSTLLQTHAANLSKLAVGSGANLYAANHTGVYTVGATSVPSSLFGLARLPDSLAVDAVGNVLTSETTFVEVPDSRGNLLRSERGVIVSTTPTGERRVLVAGFPTSITALVAGSAGKVYFGGPNAIGVYDPATGAARTFSEFGSLGSAGGLALDPAGNLYAAESGGIRKMTPQGSISSIADLSGLEGFRKPNFFLGASNVSSLVWSGGVLYATIDNAVVRIALPD